MKSLRQYMQSRLGITLGSALDRVDFELARTFSSAAERMLSEFPGLRGQVQAMEGGLRGSNIYAGARFDGTIELNPGRMKSMEKVRSDYAGDVARGFHPAGTDTANIVVHELGHQIEAALIRRKYPGDGNYRAQGEAWKKSTVARDLVAQGLDRVAPGWRQNPRIAGAHVQSISGYAGRDASETFAEAISDAYSNGRRAKPLSRALWQLAKEALG